MIKKTKAGEQEWSLGYDSLDKLDDAFFKTLPQVEIPDVMMHIGDHAPPPGSYRNFLPPIAVQNNSYMHWGYYLI